MRATFAPLASAAAVVAGIVFAALPTQAAVLFDQTLPTTSVVNGSPGDINNCIAGEGCLGFGSATPIPAVLPPVSFLLNDIQVALITSMPVVGRFTVTAARDIGHKTGATGVDFLVTTAEGNAIGNLFENTIDSCPAGERGTDYANDLLCGPNFHTDVSAADTLVMASILTQLLAADNIVTFTMDPTAAVGRLKFFSYRLVIESVETVPEPSTAALAVLAGLAAAWLRRRRPPAGPQRSPAM